jgi:hypothetical protein
MILSRHRAEDGQTKERTMSNRREFLFQGLAVAAVSGLTAQTALAAEVSGAEASDAAHSPVARIVFDTRFNDSVAFAQPLADAGHWLEPIQGDITRLWLDRLEPALRGKPQAIAGMTTERSFLCLEMLASGHGLRSVFHAEHLYLGDRHIEHTLRAPAELLASATSLSRAAAAWPAATASLVARYRAGRRPAPATRLYAARLAAPAQAGVEALVSWVLAPLPRA